VDRRIKPARPGARTDNRGGGVDDLVMLAELHRNGVLTDEEFAAKKRQVLGI
jgi:Short C-terminal domain